MNDAILSPCGRYRYRLERDVGLFGITIAYFGINLSTADASIEDQTVRKWRGFAKIHGARRFIVGNAFARRATATAALASASDPRGPENRRYLDAIIAAADLLIPCWGARGKLTATLRPDLDAMRALARGLCRPQWATGATCST